MHDIISEILHLPCARCSPSCWEVAGKGTSRLPLGHAHIFGTGSSRLVLSGNDASLKNVFEWCQGGWQGGLETGKLITGTTHVRLRCLPSS